MVLKSTRCSPSAKIPNIDDSMLTSTEDNLNQDIKVSDNGTNSLTMRNVMKKMKESDS